MAGLKLSQKSDNPFEKKWTFRKLRADSAYTSVNVATQLFDTR